MKYLFLNSSPTRHLLTLAGLSCALLGFSTLGALADTVVYSNDFTAGAGSEWSNNTTVTSNGEKFLGANQNGSLANGFGNGSDTLSLLGLAAHDTVTISFDLYIIQSWDGNGPNGGGPDNYTLAQNGMNLLLTNFANFTGGNTQAYSAATPNGLGAMNAPRSGESDAGHLGFGTGDFGDATYHFSLTFASAASALVFDFTSFQTEAPGNEGWGLDNVNVSISGNGSPIPDTGSTAALLGLGALGLACAGRWMRA